MDQPIEVFDLSRMFFGNEPPLFLLEIVLRTRIIYGYALVLLRFLGSRAIGQLSTIEFLLVIALGSAVGDAMFYPDVPLLHALVVITVVVALNKVLDLVIARSVAAEHMIDGVPVEVIRDGVVNRRFLEGSTLTRSEIFQKLREKGVEQLGEVRRAYLETDGTLTIFKAEGSAPGLPIVPPWEVSEPTDAPHGAPRRVACRRCGSVAGEASRACSNCGHHRWVQAQS